jgi:hypothetical protein
MLEKTKLWMASGVTYWNKRAAQLYGYLSGLHLNFIKPFAAGTGALTHVNKPDFIPHIRRICLCQRIAPF